MRRQASTCGTGTRPSIMVVKWSSMVIGHGQRTAIDRMAIDRTRTTRHQAHHR